MLKGGELKMSKLKVTIVMCVLLASIAGGLAGNHIEERFLLTSPIGGVGAALNYTSEDVFAAVTNSGPGVASVEIWDRNNVSVTELDRVANDYFYIVVNVTDGNTIDDLSQVEVTLNYQNKDYIGDPGLRTSEEFAWFQYNESTSNDLEIYDAGSEMVDRYPEGGSTLYPVNRASQLPEDDTVSILHFQGMYIFNFTFNQSVKTMYEWILRANATDDDGAYSTKEMVFTILPVMGEVIWGFSGSFNFAAAPGTINAPDSFTVETGDGVTQPWALIACVEGDFSAPWPSPLSSTAFQIRENNQHYLSLIHQDNAVGCAARPVATDKWYFNGWESYQTTTNHTVYLDYPALIPEEPREATGSGNYEGPVITLVLKYCGDSYCTTDY